MSDCLFCKIARKEMSGSIVYEDDDLLAFKDIQPQAPVHILVIPKRHISGAMAATAGDAAILGRMILLSKILAERFSVSECGFRLVVNSGVDAGQAVAHLHMHFLGGRKLKWPPG